jgi:hypothetical protein
MIILQILLGLGSFGIIGFVLYWLGVALHAGPEAEKNQINNDPRI